MTTETIYTGPEDACEYIWAGIYSAGAVSAFVLPGERPCDDSEVRIHKSHGPIAKQWMEQNGYRKPSPARSETAGSLF